MTSAAPSPGTPTLAPLVFCFDPVSPYAWLAFERLPQALEGLSVSVDYRPVLLGGLLKHWGQLGPAEIAPKREWTYRHVAWQAHELGVPLHLPAAHPFNPVPLLRLALACAPAGVLPNRRFAEAVLRHVWADEPGADPTDAQRLRALADMLAPVRDPQGEDVKAELRVLTERSAGEGVFGVPTVLAGSRLFWGLEGLPVLAAALRGEPWFDGPGWAAVAQVRYGLPPRGPQG